MKFGPIKPGKPLLDQLEESNIEFDQLLQTALEVSASKPDVSPEDIGFPDSYLTLALYRLNSILSRIVELDQTRYNIFHEYLRAPKCYPREVVPGNRLSSVLNTAIELAQDGNTIGVGHFLRAIVNLTLDEPAGEYGDWALHNTFSAETLLWGLGYSAWTKVDDAPELVNILHELDGREQIQDHQYLLIVQKGRLVFRPTSILDPFNMLRSDDTTSERLAVLPHFRNQFPTFRPSEILELESLINDRNVNEADLQGFLERHTHFFRSWDYREVYPQVILTREEDGDLIPDFILLDPDLQKAMILDLKLPTKKIVVGTQNRKRYSAPVFEARTQLLRYRDWFEESRNREKIKEEFGIEVYRPRLAVVIGRKAHFENEFQRQQLRSDQDDFDVVTYDDILEQAKRRLILIESSRRECLT
jgi:hypothetical protein